MMEGGTNDSSAALIFIILSLKQITKREARSVGLTRSGKITVEDLCRILEGAPQSLEITIVFNNNCGIVPTSRLFE